MKVSAAIPGVLVSFAILLSLLSCQVDEEFRGASPQDAYLPGSPYPYYGCEGSWDRRFFSEETASGQYKRRGQRQMIDIVEGRYDQAIEYCRRMLASDPEDLESLFNLAIALAQRGELQEALETSERAVAKGLPFERFQAGPRDLLKPLYEYEPYQVFSAQRSSKLIHGPMVGSVSDERARFWVRTAAESSVRVRLTEAESLAEPVQSEAVMTLSETDFTGVIEMTGLKPSTHYRYDVEVDGKPVLDFPHPSFRTYPAAGESTRFKVAFGGGAGFVPEHERIWDLILAKAPSALLLLGDNVYVDLPEMPNGLHYYTYYRRQSRPEFRRLVSNVPVFAIWDDHDSGIDDVWLGPFKDKPAWKMPLFDQFKENWVNPSYGDAHWPGCWYDFAVGDVQFFMLDGRFYRTNPFAENPTMLGPIQKQWLKERLEASDATFKVVVSPVPWAFEAKDAIDTWNGFQKERNEIFAFLAEKRINGVLLLSADRHRSDAWLIKRESGYPLYEFESSRLTNQHVHEVMPQSLFGYNEKQSFGLLTFDTTLPDPAVIYQIYSIDDELIETLAVRRSEMEHQ